MARIRLHRAAAVLAAIALGYTTLTSTGSTASPGTTPAEMVDSMSLEEKVGQLFVVPVYGAEANTAHPKNREEFGVDTPAEVVQKYHPGGVIHFTWTDSLQDPEQIAELSNGLQTAATSSGAGIPLLISTDQEQGAVTRIGAPATQFPGNMALGASRSQEDAERAAAITGQELRAMGINFDLAPSGDVNVNPENPVIGVRSFSSDPRLAAQLTAAQIRGYQDSAATTGTVSASVKHFPGHGDTNLDSHTDLPVIEHDRAQWEQLDAPPFAAAIAARVDSVMSAHIVMPKLDDSGEPSTLSPNVLTGMLRSELGFDGVVITDSLRMEGVRQKHSDSEVPVLALEAGADLLLMPPNLQTAIDGVIDAVRSGDLTEERIDKSVERILEMKQRRGILSSPHTDPARAVEFVGNPEHRKDAQRITDRTTTLLRNENGVLPLQQPGKVLVTGSGEDATAALAESVRARGARATALPTGNAPTAEQIDQAVAAAGRNDVVVVLTNGAWQTDRAAQLDLVRALQETDKPVVAVATGDPYDAGHVDAPAWVVTYSDKAVAMESLTKVLFGEISPTGELPVPVPDPNQPGADKYPFGHGLAW